MIQDVYGFDRLRITIAFRETITVASPDSRRNIIWGVWRPGHSAVSLAGRSPKSLTNTPTAHSSTHDSPSFVKRTANFSN